MRCDEIGGVEDIFTFKNMYKAGKDCCKGVRWKGSVQRFEAHLFSKTAVSRKKLLKGEYQWSKYVHFLLTERGKVREIDAPRIEDRQVHKVLTRDGLLPVYRPSMIYNNGASLRGKGFDFSINELKEDLRWHFRRYGIAGYIVLMDFKKFFPSVSHKEVRKRHERYICNEGIRTLADSVLDTIKGECGLPLGVEPSQAEMIAFPSKLDNYIKCQLGLKCAGHYMDDYYIIVPPERDPNEILRLIDEKATELKLNISKAKTRIAPFGKPFRFCKLKYVITESGKVLVHGNRDNVKRARHKIKAFKKMLLDGKMSLEDLWASVHGCIAYFEKYDDHNRVLKLRRLFYSVYGFSCERIAEFRKGGKGYGIYSAYSFQG